MKWYSGENHRIKEKAGEDTVIFLNNWKDKVKRYRIYRRCLMAALLVSCMTLVGVTYYHIDSSIPSVIHVRANREQSFLLGVPAKGEVVSTGGQRESNIPGGAVTIDLSRPVTMKTGGLTSLEMQVKLFGFLPFKQVGIRVIEDAELFPVGQPVGIYIKTKGIMVIGIGKFQGQDGLIHSPAENIVKSGDYIQALNGVAVADKNDLIKKVEECDGSEQILTIKRGNSTIDLKIHPVKDQQGKYKIGTWVRDNSQGVGTMTFIDGDGKFGALGHGINDVDAGILMEIEDGTLYQTEIVSINKGVNGEPGGMTGMIVYSKERILGDITDNREEGIFGICNDAALEKLPAEDALPIGLKQELEKGVAQILCSVDGTARYYDVEIIGIRLDNDNVNRGIELRVTDPMLLELTGGIVQGMSGSPIIQDGKLVGAVTHVLVNDPTRGYGIFIENMLDAAG